MRISEEQLAAGGIFVVIAAMLVWFFSTQAQAPIVQEAAPVATPEPESPCGQVVRTTCEMLIKEKTPQCKRDLVEAPVIARLAEPMADPACKKAQNQLAEGCPPECVFDFATLVLVPGRAQFDFFDERDETGQCFLRARRIVAMQGKCAERSTPVPLPPAG